MAHTLTIVELIWPILKHIKKSVSSDLFDNYHPKFKYSDHHVYNYNNIIHYQTMFTIATTNPIHFQLDIQITHYDNIFQYFYRVI